MENKIKLYIRQQVNSTKEIFTICDEYTDRKIAVFYNIKDAKEYIEYKTQ